MNWGFKIALSILAFMAIIITMVVICMKQDVSLVASDYYKQEIAYQKHIDQQRNAILSADQVQLNYEPSMSQFVIISKKNAEGELHLYRPSDASKDIKVPFKIVIGEKASVSTRGLVKGLWKAKLTWTENDKVFYLEKSIVI